MTPPQVKWSRRLELLFDKLRFDSGLWLRSQTPLSRRTMNLLRDDAFRMIERRIATAIGEQMAPEDDLWRSVPYVGRNLNAAEISPEDLPRLLAEHELIVIELIKEIDPRANAYDEPKCKDAAGEVCEEEVVVDEVLGRGPGFSLGYLIPILYFKDRSLEELITYFNEVRISPARRYAIDLQQAYQRLITVHGN